MTWITNENVSGFHCSKASHWALDDLMVLFVLYNLKKSYFVEQKKSYGSDFLSTQRVSRKQNTLLQNKRIGFDRRSVRCFQKRISLHRVRVQRRGADSRLVMCRVSHTKHTHTCHLSKTVLLESIAMVMNDVTTGKYDWQVHSVYISDSQHCSKIVLQTHLFSVICFFFFPFVGSQNISVK